MTTEPQHMTALEWANEIRLGRGKLKKDFREGRISLSEFLDHKYVASMRLLDVFMVPKRWGRARAKRLLVSCGIPSEYKQVQTLTTRQRVQVELEFNRQRRTF